MEKGFDRELEGQAVRVVGGGAAALKVLPLVDGGNKEREGKPFDHPRELIHESRADMWIEQNVERPLCKADFAAMEVDTLVVPVTKLETRNLGEDHVTVSRALDNERLGGPPFGGASLFAADLLKSSGAERRAATTLTGAVSRWPSILYCIGLMIG